ncbi:hypothetical protein Tco_0965829 [Tanacetum coccineum]
MDNFLLLNLKTMFEHHVEDSVWKNQQGLVKVLNWKLYDSCRVHCVRMQSILYYLLDEKMYPLTNHTLHQMFNDVKLQVDYEYEMAFELLRLLLMKKHEILKKNIMFRGGLLGLNALLKLLLLRINVSRSYDEVPPKSKNDMPPRDKSVEAEFPAIAFNDSLISSETLSCEPTVSSLNDEIDFRISFDDSDDEDYTVIFDKNSFSYKIISTNDLKTDSENDNEKVNMHSLPLLEPTVSCFEDLDFFNNFENEFPAIVYNNAQTSKSDLLTKRILSPQHIDEFDLNDETSLSEFDEEEQNILYFNDLFPFNIIQPDDLKLEKDNDDNKVDIIQSSGECLKFYNLCTILVDFTNMTLLSHDQRHQYLRYEGLQYSDADIVDFKTRLARMYRREVHRVKVLDFGGLPGLMAEGLSVRMLMEHMDAQGVNFFTSRAWRRLFDIRGPLVHELILEFFSTFRFREAESARQIADKGDLRDYWIGISSTGDFLGTAPSYTSIRDPILRDGRWLDQPPYLLARYMRLFATGRKSGDLISEGQFVARLAEHFIHLPEERLWGMTVIAPALSVIDRAELVRLQICVEIDDTWAWVALGPERQPDAAVGTPKAADDAPVVDEGGQAVPAPV